MMEQKERTSVQAASVDTQDLEKRAKTPTKHGSIDSGFEDTTETPKAIQSRSTSTTPQNDTPSSLPRKLKSRPTSRTTSFTRTATTSRSSSRHPTVSSDCSRPTSSHYTLSRGSSRRSSLLTNQRPLPHRDAFTSYIHLHENPFLPQTKRSALVHTFTTHETFPRTTSPPLAHLRSPSLPTLPSTSTATFPPRPESPSEPRPLYPRSYSNYVPATTIDWKLPSTRQKEYETIDRNCRGVRGLWRKLAPGWCIRDKVVNFWDQQNDSDSGSVRRYRVEVEKDAPGAEGSLPSIPGKGERRRGWRSCFMKRRRYS